MKNCFFTDLILSGKIKLVYTVLYHIFSICQEKILIALHFYKLFAQARQKTRAFMQKSMHKRADIHFIQPQDRRKTRAIPVRSFAFQRDPPYICKLFPFDARFCRIVWSSSIRRCPGIRNRKGWKTCTLPLPCRAWARCGKESLQPGTDISARRW